MSTRQRTKSEPAELTTSTRLDPGNAPRTFSPHNTNPCPRMFADKWAVEPDAS